MRELLARLTAPEIAEWIAFDQIEPFGEWRADLRAGIVAATVANAARGGRSSPLRPKDFMPDFDKPAQSEASLSSSPQVFKAYAVALTKRMGGTVTHRGKKRGRNR